MRMCVVVVRVAGGLAEKQLVGAHAGEDGVVVVGVAGVGVALEMVGAGLAVRQAVEAVKAVAATELVALRGTVRP